jgi:V/A-type H+/Na+-transporting ATPase subunit I
MLRPRKMKFFELTVFKDDINTVLEYLGTNGAMHFSDSQPSSDNKEIARIDKIIERLHSVCKYINAEIPPEPKEDVSIPNEASLAFTEKLCSILENLKGRELRAGGEKQHLLETLEEVKTFSKMNVSYTDLSHLSYLTLRIGRLDPKKHDMLRENLKGRALVIPLDDNDRILAACSRKGRFVMDSELKKIAFEPVTVPENYKNISDEMLKSLEEQLNIVETELKEITDEKAKISKESASELVKLIMSWQAALTVEQLKSRLVITGSVFVLSGWIPQYMVKEAVKGLLELCGGRVAIRSYNPDEISSVRDGKEKVPVLFKHGSFVKGFEGMVSSFGTPPYGTIDPTPLVALFYTLIFGVMFGDLGQGFVLFLLGFLSSSRGLKIMAGFRKYSTALISVGIASMFMGILNGAVFTNEELLVEPTRIVSAAIIGHPVDRALNILPMAEKGGSITKLLYFFGFTIGIGIVLNTLGMIINITNRCILKKYIEAFFSRTGFSGLVLFWYSLFTAFRLFTGSSIKWYDITVISVSFFCILFAPVIIKSIAQKKSALEHGVFTFVIEVFVEVLETISTYFSNTISFVRVGAFALSHAVLSYVVFYFTETLVVSGPAGTFPAALLLIFGNSLIIVLEGLIVAIQVVRLQYYEFFSKFFFETGVAFTPFRFKSIGGTK